MNKKRGLSLGILFVVLLTATSIRSLFTQAQTLPEPGETGPCAVASGAVSIDTVAVEIFYPVESCDAYVAPPYPLIAFAHGFSMFGLADGVADNQENGRHLASWGYVVAIPDLPDDAEERTTIVLEVIAYVEDQNNDTNSFLYHLVDLARVATAGHSLGGATALSAAARNEQIIAVVALDPVYHTGGFGGGGEVVWDPVPEAGNITAATAILGAPPDSCNSDADYLDLYPLIGADHKAYYHLVDASHCVFADPGSSFCSLTCGGTVDPAMTQRSQKYMTAWFGYYLQDNPAFFTYLYDTQLAADINAGLITHDAETFPQGFAADPLPQAVHLRWQLTKYPIISGYQIYRRQSGSIFPQNPQIVTGLESASIDWGLVGNQVYEYVIRSYDRAGNLHQLTEPVTAVPLESKEFMHIPIIHK